jgi:hypothetical protein
MTDPCLAATPCARPCAPIAWRTVPTGGAAMIFTHCSPPPVWPKVVMWVVSGLAPPLSWSSKGPRIFKFPCSRARNSRLDKRSLRRNPPSIGGTSESPTQGRKKRERENSACSLMDKIIMQSLNRPLAHHELSQQTYGGIKRVSTQQFEQQIICPVLNTGRESERGI